MLLALLSALQLVAAAPSPAAHDGRKGQTTVHIPSFQQAAVIDGNLDEPMWRHAAVLDGFSEYQPVDGRPAPDSTRVLVWYSHQAIYFGIEAFQQGGPVVATLANRDNVSSNDNVEIMLDTYNVRNHAYVFIVNPLGIQADGTMDETGGFNPGSHVGPGQVDLSEDFLWKSKGHLTPWGYQVEIRIPFSSLHYPTKSVQDWGIQIERIVQYSGYKETWTPVRRAAASFINQEGLLVGLTGMHHGQVVDLNPELTNTVTGKPCCDPSFRSWAYGDKPRLGGNVRWAMGSNFVLNGTALPDFSQVEADATQIAPDERFAVYYPEKRPFFTEGMNKFNVPNTLIYTRRIVQPLAATKLTGRVGQTDVAVLAALDDGSTTPDGQRPLVDIVRLARTFDGQSTAGLLWSERVGGGRANRVMDADVHYVFGGKYYAQLQAVTSATSQGGPTQWAPMWNAVLDGTGRRFGFDYALLGIGQDFAADNGFVQRTDMVQFRTEDRLTLYGAPRALAEQFQLRGSTSSIWTYQDFFRTQAPLEDQVGAEAQVTLRGGWQVGVTPTLESYAFDPAAYSSDFTGTPQAPVPFVPSPRITTLMTEVSVSTPQFQTFSASASVNAGHTVDFLETSRIRRVDYTLNLEGRPTPHLRVDATYQSSEYTRLSDGTRTLYTRIPYLRVAYQITPSIFVRLIGQYTANDRRPLRDPRTGQILLIRNSAGEYSPSVASVSNVLQANWLFSYRPTPFTEFFAGYGNTSAEPTGLAFNDLTRTSDTFFVKVTYLFHALGAHGAS